MRGVKPICQYMGNKLNIADWIVPMFPQHKRYVEVFGGTGAILLNKPRSTVEVYNDKNLYMSNLFESIITYPEEFLSQVRKWNVSEVRYDKFYENHPVTPEEVPNLEAALRYFYILKLCGYGKYNGGFYTNVNRHGDDWFMKAAKDVEEFEKRFRYVLCYSRDFEEIIKTFDSEDTLFYLDPPYKGTESYYEHIVGQFTEEDHIRLFDALNQSKAMWYLSYEEDEFITDLYTGYNILSTTKHRPGSSSTKRAKEILITNTFPSHNFLFDEKEMSEQLNNG